MISKTLYGSIFLSLEDLIETPINYPVELAYYKTNETIKKHAIYGVEVVKNEYQNDRINTERNVLNLFTENEIEVDKILEAMEKYKVTPIGANDVLYELIKSGSV